MLLSADNKNVYLSLEPAYVAGSIENLREV